MPDYQIKYTVDNSQALSAINQLTAALNGLDKKLDQVKPKLQNVAKGSSAPFGALSRAAERAAASIGTVGTAASGTQTQLTATANAVGTINQGFKESTASGQSFGRIFGVISTSAVALGAVRQIIHATGEAFEEARDFARETAEETLHLRDAVRELRTTKGGGTTTTSATNEVKDLMLKTGASQQAAVAFDTIWESTVPAAKKKGNWGLNAAQTQDAKVQALAFAVSNGIDEKTMGEVTPMIATGEKIESVDQLLGKVGTMTKLAIEGVGNLGPMMKVYEKLRGSMVNEKGGGAFKSSEELLAAISTESVDAGNVPAVTQSINQIWRDLSFADNDNKAMTFEKLGINPADDYQTRIHKLKPMLDASRAAGQNDQETLFNAGFRRTGSHRKLIQAVNEIEILDKNMENARQAPNGQEVRAQNAAFAAQNPDRFARNSIEVQRINRGEQERNLKTARDFAEAILVRDKETGTSKTEMEDTFKDMFGLGPALGGDPAKMQRQDAKIWESIRKAVPGADGRFSLFGPDGQVRPQSERTRAALNGLSAAERQAVFADLQGRANQGGVPAQQGIAPGGAAPSVQAPTVAPGGAGATGVVSAVGIGMGPLMLGVNQLVAETKKTNQLLAQRQAQLPNGGGAVVPGRK